MNSLPLQLLWLDNELLAFHVGQALLVGFVLTVLAVLPLKSQKILSLTLGTFGLLFAAVPIQASSALFRMFGIALVIVAPLLYVASDE